MKRPRAALPPANRHKGFSSARKTSASRPAVWALFAARSAARCGQEAATFVPVT